MYQELGPGLEAFYFESVGSTMDQARFMVGEGYGEGTVVMAKKQMVGRGRLGRQWISEPGNLYFTYISQPGCSVAKAAEMSFVACLALGDGLRRFITKKSDKLQYKWPNDILLNGQKVAGILLETMGSDPEHVDAVLIGAGVNLKNYPPGVPFPVTSFLDEGIDLSLEEALKSVSQHMQGAIEMWRRQGFIPIKNRWMEHVYGLGSLISVRQGDQLYTGNMVGLDDNGALKICSKIGAEDTITAGDVIFGDVTSIKD